MKQLGLNRRDRTDIRIMLMVAALVTALVTTAPWMGCSRDKPDQKNTENPPVNHTYATPLSKVKETAGSPTTPAGGLPRMIDLGKGWCIPCKKMAPILKELQQKYEGRVVIEIIDLGQDKDAASRYGVRVMPTQIFFDAAGAEVWRHEGFLSRDAIIDKFREMGVEPPDD